MSNRGFTLLEVLLSVAIIGIVVGITIPIYQSFQFRNDLSVTTQGIAEMLRRAESYSRAVNDDSVWSVDISSSAATLYKGTVFGSRDATFDEVITIPGSMTTSFTGDINFAKFTGAPSSTPTITLTSSTTDTGVITLNAKGLVSY